MTCRGISPHLLRLWDISGGFLKPVLEIYIPYKPLIIDLNLKRRDCLPKISLPDLPNSGDILLSAMGNGQ